jgi:RNA polymerase sigma factor (TIGR02999 family)
METDSDTDTDTRGDTGTGLEPDTVTALLHAHGQGDRHAFDRLFPIVYQDLKRVAFRQRRRWQPAQTLNTTSLVHDVYVRLVDQHRIAWQGRTHFFGVAARAMRQILVDEARERGAQKRGGQWQRVELLTDALPAGSLDALNGHDRFERILALDRAFETLAAISERLVRVAECRVFAGMSEKETSEALSVPLRTVQRDWQRARAWLQRELSGEPQGDAATPSVEAQARA